MTTWKDKPSLGLALGGGAIRGAAHIGILRALEEYDFHPDFIAGTSIGSFVGCLYAFGMKPLEIRKLIAGMHWLDVSSFTLSKSGLLSNQEAGNLIKKHIGDVNIEDSHVPLSIVTGDLTTGETVVLREGSAAAAVMASTCIPGIFIPHTIDGRMLVDGGIVENVPVPTVESMGADVIVGVDLNGSLHYQKPEDIIDILLNSFDIAIDGKTSMQVSRADVLIRMDLSHYSRSDTGKVYELYAEGYRSGALAIRSIRTAMRIKGPSLVKKLQGRVGRWLS